MGILKRLFGICDTKPPVDSGGWSWNNGKLEIDLERTGELSSKGGAVRLEGGGLPNRVLVLRGEDEKLHAFSNKCTHGGRRLDPLPGQSKVRCCSVGKSTFDYEGKVFSGTTQGDVHTYPVSFKMADF